MTMHLHGLKILDFGYFLPGPFGTLMLADLRADIINIENPSNPDMTRRMGGIVGGISAAYLCLKRGKRSRSLDLKKTEAREIVMLLRIYESVVAQLRPGVMDRFGLGYEALREVQPRLIYCSLTGYGQTVSYRYMPGRDINYLALAGIESYSERASAGPAPGALRTADICGGSRNLVIALLASVIRRMETRKGEYIDVSIADGAFAFQALHAGAIATGRAPCPGTEALNGGSLSDFYRTSNGRWLFVGMLEPRFRANFLAAVGVPEVEFASLSMDALAAQKCEVARAIESKPPARWERVFSQVEACVEPVRTTIEDAGRPPFADRGMIIGAPTVKGAPIKQFGNPLRFSSGDRGASFAGTPVGHRNAGIFHDAGVSAQKIRALHESGAPG
jgi:alpha-methylacyl-CoA racemase